MKEHTVKRIALPSGWESFELIESGHPGEGWLSTGEFAELAGVNFDWARKRLKARDDMDTCTRRVNGHNTVFFRPKSLAKTTAKAKKAR